MDIGSLGSGVRANYNTGSTNTASSGSANSGPQDANAVELANFAAGLQGRSQHSGGVYA